MTEYCAVDSRCRGETLHGTASRARRWVLLEHPGAWGANAIRESGLPPGIVDRLGRWSRQLPARVLLLRRTSGRRPLGEGRTLFAGVSSPAGSWIEEFELGGLEEVLKLDLQGLAAGESVGGRRLTEPLYLVCTNGKHDACCARDGLPVARELTRTLGARVWECSHVGGDRFAANLVCLPEGHFYGHVDPDSARIVVEANESGELMLDHWRGRSCHPFEVQAAEALVRRRLGLVENRALRVDRARRDGARYDVHFTHGDGGRIHAQLEVVPGATSASLTCRGTQATVPSYALIGLWKTSS